MLGYYFSAQIAPGNFLTPVSFKSYARFLSRNSDYPSLNGQKISSNSRCRKSIVFAVSEGAFSKSRRELLVEYVKTVKPEFMEKFIQRAPNQVVDAMRQTVSNLVGTLPSQFFEVTVTTVGESLAQLMYSLLMTGYMFHNAHYRMELESSLQDLSQSPSSPPRSHTSSVRGHVLLPPSSPRGERQGDRESGDPEAVDAAEYIEGLEAELEDLRRQLACYDAEGGKRGGSSLLDYLKELKPQNLQELTSGAGDDSLEAMNLFIQRLMGVADTAELRSSTTETNATELAKLLYWLMVVGYGIRSIEVRHEMERILGSTPKYPELLS